MWVVETSAPMYALAVLCGMQAGMLVWAFVQSDTNQNTDLVDESDEAHSLLPSSATLFTNTVPPLSVHLPTLPGKAALVAVMVLAWPPLCYHLPVLTACIACGVSVFLFVVFSERQVEQEQVGRTVTLTQEISLELRGMAVLAVVIVSTLPPMEWTQAALHTIGATFLMLYGYGHTFTLCVHPEDRREHAKQTIARLFTPAMVLLLSPGTTAADVWPVPILAAVYGILHTMVVTSSVDSAQGVVGVASGACVVWAGIGAVLDSHITSTTPRSEPLDFASLLLADPVSPFIAALAAHRNFVHSLAHTPSPRPSTLNSLIFTALMLILSISLLSLGSLPFTLTAACTLAGSLIFLRCHLPTDCSQLFVSLGRVSLELVLLFPLFISPWHSHGPLPPPLTAASLLAGWIVTASILQSAAVEVAMDLCRPLFPLIIPLALSLFPLHSSVLLAVTVVVVSAVTAFLAMSGSILRPITLTSLGLLCLLLLPLPPFPDCSCTECLPQFYGLDTFSLPPAMTWHCGYSQLGRDHPRSVQRFLELLPHRHITFIGDSHGRNLALNTAPLLTTHSPYLPHFERHSSFDVMIASTAVTVSVVWAPYVEWASRDVFLACAESDICVVSLGLWDMLHKRNTAAFAQNLTTLLSPELARVRDVGVHVVMMELAEVNEATIAPHKVGIITNPTVDEYNIHIRGAARALGVSSIAQTPISRHQTHALTDGIHHSRATYRTIAAAVCHSYERDHSRGIDLPSLPVRDAVGKGIAAGMMLMVAGAAALTHHP